MSGASHQRKVLASSSVACHEAVRASCTVSTVSETSTGLTVVYRPEGSEDVGELHVTASVPPFAGAAVGYFNDSDILEWLGCLRAYPWTTGARQEISAAVGDQETVNLSAFVVTSRGQLGVAVHLAVLDYDAHSPTVGAVSETRLLVLTSYEAIRNFADELADAIAKSGGTAHLAIDELL